MTTTKVTAHAALRTPRATGGARVSQPGAGQVAPVANVAPVARAQVDAHASIPPLPPAVVRRWPEAARRELDKHLQMLGAPAAKDPGAAIRKGELAIAKAADPRVNDVDMARAVKRAAEAMRAQPEPVRALFAFTRVVDAKLTFDADALDRLSFAVAPDAASQANLRRLVKDGPDDGTKVWQHPSDLLHLVASIVRQIALGDGASLQITVDPSLSHALYDALGSSTTVKEAMGGAGAFVANLASAQPGITSSFFSTDPLPGKIAARFAPGVQLLGKAGRQGRACKAGDDALPARVNYAAEYGGDQPLRFLGASTVDVGGKDMEVRATKPGRVILSAQAKDIVPGFDGVSPAQLAKMGRDADIAFVVGPHYFTADDRCSERTTTLAGQLDAMKQANPSLMRHFQYVVPKKAAHEPAMLTALRGHVESMSLNSVELPGLVGSLRTADLAQGQGATMTLPVDKEAMERPQAMLDQALAVVDALHLDRFHAHGFEGDLMVLRDCDDPQRQVTAALKARQLAAMKASNASGEILSADDMWPLVPSVKGSGLAAVYAFADAVQQRYGLDDAAHARVVRDWSFTDGDSGTTMIFAPSRGIHDTTGGTVSLGDTIDGAALLYAARTKRGPALKHGTAFQDV